MLGGTGTMGSRIARLLGERGHEVLAASRAGGVDAVGDRGLREALRRADAVVDCLNHETLSGRRAVDFFSTAARNVSVAAEREGVGRILVVSIYGAEKPEVNRLMGYYRGKAAQERAYGFARTPVSVLRSTQWFELIPAIVSRTSRGPLALPPAMRMAAVAADRVAALAADDVEAAGSGDRLLTIRGPEVATAAQMARTLMRLQGAIGGRSPRLILPLPYLGRAIASGALVPEDGVVDPVTLTDWARGLPHR